MTRLLTWYGQLTTARNLRLRGLSCVIAPTLWLVLLLLLPILALAVVAFLSRGPWGGVEPTFTWDNLARLVGYTSDGWSGNYLWIFGRSILVGAVTTLLCLLLGYPLAFFIATRGRRSRYVWLTLVVIPLCTNLVIRTLAWRLLLGNQMAPARLAEWLGLIEPDGSLYPGHLAIYLGMVTCFLPFTVLPIYTNAEALDWSIVEAARDLYAGRLRTFFHAVLPQTLPGLAAAVILTFVPAMGMFVVTDVLGGGKTMLVGNVIYNQFFGIRDYPFGAAFSLLLMLLSLVAVLVFRGRVREAAL